MRGLIFAIGALMATPSYAQSADVAPAQSLASARLSVGGVNLTPTDATGHAIHIMPTQSVAQSMRAVTTTAGPLNYHGGPIMPTIEIYNIFWVGALQAGGSAALTSFYTTAANNLGFDYPGKTLDSNNTQYYQTSPVLNYVHGLSPIGGGGSLGGTYVDTTPFPTSQCTDSVTPGDCIIDSQVQAEVKKIMAINGWNADIHKIYILYTGPGEGSCFTSASSSCAYTAYCGYHGAISTTSGPIIYANMPYAGMPGCEVSSSPTGHLGADSVVNIASHEISEAITDPELNAWWDPMTGGEIGDLCAWTFGTNLYDSSLANQQWNGNFYELQMEYDNLLQKCVQNGPN